VEEELDTPASAIPAGLCRAPGLLAWALPHCPRGDLNELCHAQPDRVLVRSAAGARWAAAAAASSPSAPVLWRGRGGRGAQGHRRRFAFLGREEGQAGRREFFFLVSGRVGPTQVPRAGMAGVGEKKRPFLAETLSKLRFFGTS
jgi:hypothetical protein